MNGVKLGRLRPVNTNRNPYNIGMSFVTPMITCSAHFFGTAMSVFGLAQIKTPPINTDGVANLSIPTITLIVMLVTLVAWPLGAWLERKKNLPVLEQERAFRLQAEAQWQSESDRAAKEKDELTARNNSANGQITELTTKVNALTAEVRIQAESSSNTVAQLTAEVATAQQKQKEVEVELTTANTKIASVEAALEAEKGRIAAMQEALEAKQDLAKQLAQELSSTRNAFADERAAAAGREDELRGQLANYEKTAASGQSMIEVVNSELEKTRLAQADLEKEYGNKFSDLQRKLSAADQKSAMLQKEIMALVGSGGASDAAEVVTQAEEMAKALERAKIAEKKAAELEAQLAQGDVGTRKRLREAEYKICELEYKLAQTDEGKGSATEG